MLYLKAKRGRMGCLIKFRHFKNYFIALLSIIDYQNYITDIKSKKRNVLQQIFNFEIEGMWVGSG